MLKSFGGHQLDTVGKRLLDTKANTSQGFTPLEYYIIRDNVGPLLGLESCLRGGGGGGLKLKFITFNDTVEQVGLSIDDVQRK